MLGSYGFSVPRFSVSNLILEKASRKVGISPLRGTISLPETDSKNGIEKICSLLTQGWHRASGGRA